MKMPATTLTTSSSCKETQKLEKNEARKCSCLWSFLGQTGAVAGAQYFTINWLGHLGLKSAASWLSL